MSTRAQQQRTMFPQFIPERIRRHIQISNSRIWKDITPLDVLFSPANPLLSSFKDAQAMTFSPITPGTVFTEAGWTTVWFYLELPEEATHVLWEVNGESTIFYGGEPWCGLDTAHRWARIPAEARELYIRCSTYETGIWMHAGERRVPEPAVAGYQFYQASAAVRDTLQWNIYNDLLLLEEYLRHELEKRKLNSPDVGKHKKLEYLPVRLRKLLHNTDLAIDAYDLDDFHGCSRQLKELLKSRKTREFPNGSLSLIGNSHLDLVWLWPEKATREKNVHTCSTILRLMEEYPNMNFTMSQPWLLDALQTDAPNLYQQVKQRIDEQRWELTGGMYVEADTLIPCGEALARACVLGQRVFQRETGKLCPTLWLPDVFGYSQSIPQIASAAGITNFYTTKLLWSSIQSFPFTSFVWQSMDGSELLCHISQVGYESRASVEDLTRCSEANKQAALHDDAILAMGFGDGGGGLTDEQCERAERLGGLFDLPAASWQRTDQFFFRLSEVRHQLPRYRGELYLEYHRGTYTTKHAMKQAYRRAEKALQTAEAAAAYTGKSENTRKTESSESTGNTGNIREQEDLTPLWRELVFSQFHDALPGSSIAMVYEEIIPQLQDIARRAETAAAVSLSTEESRPVVFNPNGIDGSWLMHLDPSEINTINKEPESSKQHTAVPVQQLHDGSFAALVSAEGLSASEVSFSEAAAWHPSNPIHTVTGDRVEAHFSDTGFLDRLKIDGTPLQLSKPANFLIYPDYPANYDAWEIDRSAKNLGSHAFTSMELKCIDNGPLLTRLKAEGNFGQNSSLEITYSIVKHQPYLFVSVSVNWQEEHTLLTYHVPTGYSGLYSRFGTPFGSIDRLTASGSYQKEAMWELPASRWMAVTDGNGTGLAVLTENTYGYAVSDGAVELSLLRSPCSSDEQGIKKEEVFDEKGVHTFSFALGLYCRETSGDQLSTAQAADTLFLPPILTQSAAAGPLFKIKKAGTLVVSWVKPAETCSGYVIRLHEAAGCRGEAVIELPGISKEASKGLSKAEVICTDLLERPQQHLEVSDETIHLSYSPYELLSVLVTPLRQVKK